MSKPIFTQDSLAKIAAAQAAANEASPLIPDVIPTMPGDLLVRAGAPLEDAAILIGDYLVVRPTTTADDGTVVIAAKGGEYTVTRAPVRDGAKVTGLVVGVLRSLV